MKDKIYLMFVDIKGSKTTKDGVTQSNKFYNMTDKGNGTFDAEYGRVGSSSVIKNYPMMKWDSTYKSKVRKGYKDISVLKAVKTVVATQSDNVDFNEFYNLFRKYTGDSVKKTYLVEGCSQGQIDEAQALINKISKTRKIDDMNKALFDLYKVIPRRMNDVRNHMITSLVDKSKIISIEQDALDSMDSANIMNVSNPFEDLNIEFKDVTSEVKKLMEDKLYPTMDTNYRYGSRNAKIHKVYAIFDEERTIEQDAWIAKQENKSCQLLIHGTRNANVFGILKSGLLIRPSNAYFSGAVYGDGVYHSAHSAKSLGYTGNDKDKLFFMQNVHMGNHYEYSGYYRAGKDLDRSEMNYKSLRNKGKYDSLYVSAGDGLLNSEYIVYNKEQTNTKYLVWMKES